VADINQLREIAMDSIESVHVAYTKLVAENNALRAECDAHLHTLLARNDSIIRLRQANTALENEVRTLRATSNDQALRAECEELRAQRDALCVELDVARTNWYAAQQQNTELYDKLQAHDNLSDVNDRQRKRIIELSDECRDLRDEISDLKTTVRVLRTVSD
jgi:uncharacterized coiled-coil DUF342 family protein